MNERNSKGKPTTTTAAEQFAAARERELQECTQEINAVLSRYAAGFGVTETRVFANGDISTQFQVNIIPRR